MNPPPMPREAINWFIRDVVGERSAGAIWSGVFYLGQALAAGLMAFGFIVLWLSLLTLALLGDALARKRNREDS